MSIFHSTTGTEVPQPKDVDPKESAWIGIGFAWDLGFLIAVPAILFGVLGGYLDRLLNTSPLLLFVGLAIAFITSTIIVSRSIHKILARFPKILPKKKDLVDVETSREQELLHDLFRPPSA